MNLRIPRIFNANSSSEAIRTDLCSAGGPPAHSHLLQESRRLRKTVLTAEQYILFLYSPLLKSQEKEMATHSSVLAWRIPGVGEPGGLPSMGSHRVRHRSVYRLISNLKGEILIVNITKHQIRFTKYQIWHQLHSG